MIFPFIWSRAYTPFKCPLNQHGLPRPSYAYFCPHCGEIWARFVSQYSKPWVVITSGCDRCGIPHLFSEPAGSIRLLYDPNFDNSLPLDLLEREVLLLRSPSCT